MRMPSVRLALGNFECDWSSRSMVADHSRLFGGGDAFVDFAGSGSDDASQEGLASTLSLVRDRLELLGYTMAFAKEEFSWLPYGGTFDYELFSFDVLARTLSAMEPDQVAPTYAERKGYRFFKNEIAVRLGLDLEHYAQGCSPTDLSSIMEGYSAGSVLRILAEKQANHSKRVIWSTQDVFGKQFATLDKKKPLPQADRFLIVTEGSSDALILAHAFKLLMPHVADFFYFVDMGSGYPFTGTGNLYRFTQGLIGISVENKVVILYDNDADGISNCERTAGLVRPDNVSVLRLPDLPDHQATFETIGPHGQSRMNINGRAAAIETFLDVGNEVLVRWTSYNRDLQVYQGELEGKTHFARKFLSMRQLDARYDTSKLRIVLAAIVEECVRMQEKRRTLTVAESYP